MGTKQDNNVGAAASPGLPTKRSNPAYGSTATTRIKRISCQRTFSMRRETVTRASITSCIAVSVKYKRPPSNKTGLSPLLRGTLQDPGRESQKLSPQGALRNPGWAKTSAPWALQRCRREQDLRGSQLAPHQPYWGYEIEDHHGVRQPAG